MRGSDASVPTRSRRLTVNAFANVYRSLSRLEVERNNTFIWDPRDACELFCNPWLGSLPHSDGTGWAPTGHANLSLSQTRLV